MDAMATGNDTVQQIKDRLSILDVVQPYVKLTRAGKYWKGLSPFGKEKTPSFYVSPDRGSYYCFSSSQGGDHFTFIEKMEGVDFRGALRILADKAGVEIEAMRPQDKAASDQREKLREAMHAAETFFAEGLVEGSDAYTYAASRGLTPETIRAWKLGFAPTGWRGLLEKLSVPGASSSVVFTPKELALAGLIKEADEKPGTWYDRFRNRLMFPIRDTAGRTVAFTGRALAADDQAKYLNSPETDLFKKSEVLFGMDKAKDAIRQRGFAILVEGQFDLVLLHQAGFTNTIALSGTALSSMHLGLIKRYADNLLLALDADKAGLAASARNAHAALVSGMRVKAVRLPEGKDPADIVAAEGGAKVFAEMVKNSQSIIEFFLTVLVASESDDFRLMRRIEETLLPLVAAVKSPLERNRYVDIIARQLSQTPEAVREALRVAERAQTQMQGAPPSARQGSAQARPSTPASAMGSAPISPGKNPILPASSDMQGIASRRRMLLGAMQAYPETPLAEHLKSEYNRITGVPVAVEDLQGLDERAPFEAELAFGETPHEHAGDEILYTFERMILRDALTEATRALRAAEAAGDTEAISLAATRSSELQGKLSKLS